MKKKTTLRQKDIKQNTLSVPQSQDDPVISPPLGHSKMKESFHHGVCCRQVPLPLILPLRTRVLRPHLSPPQLATFDGDHEADTFHLAAFLPKQEDPVGCATCMKRPFENDPAARQLRGMAVSPQAQSQGIGSALLRSLLSEVAARGDADLVWCNARSGAVDFYTAHGFSITAEAFEIPGVGPHHRMWLRL